MAAVRAVAGCGELGQMYASEVCRFWALEYHTLILFTYGNHYEIEVYTLFSLVTSKPRIDDKQRRQDQTGSSEGTGADGRARWGSVETHVTAVYFVANPTGVTVMILVVCLRSSNALRAF